MTVPVVLRLEAHDDLESAHTAYENARVGLGDEFIGEVRALSDRISHNPHGYGRVGRDVRAAMTRRFPYVVYYKVEPSRAVIIAILHARRPPRAWKRRA